MSSNRSSDRRRRFVRARTATLGGAAIASTASALRAAETNGATDLDSAASSWGLLALILGLACLGAYLSWRYYQRLADQRGRLRRAYSVAEQVFLAPDRDSVLQAVVQAAPGLLEATHAQVLLANPSEQQLLYVASSGSVARGAVSMSTISGPVTCFRGRETTEVPDAANCPFIDKDWVLKRNLESALYVPVLAGDSCLGVIEIEDRKHKRSFDVEQKTLAEHLARLVGMGLRLYDQRSMTEQLHRGEKLAAISELANAMAQELQPPFERIRNLATDPSLPATAQALDQRIQEISIQIGQATAAIDRLVRFATPNSGEQDEVDLNVLLRRVVGELKKRRGAAEPPIKLSLSKRTPLVKADAQHLEQVFQILLRHARHFLQQLQGRSLQIHTALRDRMVVVSMAPLSSPDQPLRGSLTKPGAAAQNSSFGLSICHALIERAGGSLHVDPTSSLGFAIEIQYPLSRSPWESADEEDHEVLRQTPQGIRSGPITALVIEPDLALQQTLVQQLSEQSYRVIPVSTAEEAIAFSSRVKLDWIFCELQMKPTSGIEIYERVRDRVEHFIFIADEAACNSNPEIFRSSDKSVLRRPFNADDVDNLIDSLQHGVELLQDA